MLFVVTRTSTRYYTQEGEVPPCPTAKRERGGPWIIEFTTLEGLCNFICGEGGGCIVIKSPEQTVTGNTEAALPEIEIYDNYRE